MFVLLGWDAQQESWLNTILPLLCALLNWGVALFILVDFKNANQWG